MMSSFITLTKHQQPRLLPGNSPPRGGSRQTFGGWCFQRQAQHQERLRRQPPAPAPFPPPPLSLFEQRACGALFCSVALSRWRGEHHSGARPSSHRGFLSRSSAGDSLLAPPARSPRLLSPPHHHHHTPTRRAVDSQLGGDFFFVFPPPPFFFSPARTVGCFPLLRALAHYLHPATLPADPAAARHSSGLDPTLLQR